MPQDKHDVYAKYKERLSAQLDSAGVRFWKPKVGTNVIRILPNWVSPDKQFFKEIYTHWGVGEKGSKVICPSTDGLQDCPICALVKELYDSKNDEDNKMARSLSRRERFACNVVDRSGKTEGVAVFEMGPQLFRDILWMFTDGDYGDLDDLTEGRDIKIDRQGSGLKDTKYSAFPAAKPSVVPPEIPAQAFDLDQVYKVPTNERLEALLTGEEAASEKEAFVEKKPSPEAEEVESELEEPDASAEDTFVEKSQPTSVAKPASAIQTAKSVAKATPTPDKSVQESRGAKLRERIMALKGGKA